MAGDARLADIQGRAASPRFHIAQWVLLPLPLPPLNTVSCVTATRKVAVFE